MSTPNQAECVAILAVSSLLAANGPARADFGLIDNFEQLPLGDISGQSGWVATGGAYTVVIDPASETNAVLRAAVSSDEARHPLSIPDGEVRMFFFRLRIGAQQNISLGLSDHLFPTEINDFEVELNMANRAPDLRANDGGTYKVIATLRADAWYNVWILVDNATNRFDVYLHDRGLQPALPGDRIAENFTFRNETAGELRSIFFKTGGGDSQIHGPCFLDDFYLEESGGFNPSNPAFCRADLTGDGLVDFSDYLEFLNYYDSGDPRADLNEDGLVDFSDYLEFLNLYDAGC